MSHEGRVALVDSGPNVIEAHFPHRQSHGDGDGNIYPVSTNDRLSAVLPDEETAWGQGWAGHALSLQRARVLSLVGEIRSHKPRGAAKKKKKKKM